MSRVNPNVRVRKQSPNISSRRGANISLIVVHATAGHNRPGVTDLISLGDWFGKTASQVSAHVASDNEGNSARFVADTDKAWHCCSFNSVSLGIEQVAPGDGTEITADLYRETARWIARWSKIHRIPIRRGAVSQSGAVLRSGVLRHSDLGTAGGNHDDPGRGYDEAHLLRLAAYYRSKL